MNCIPNKVLKAFKGDGIPQKLSGGEGNSWLVGNMVFKPIQDVERYEWAGDLLSRIPQVGFRISLPRKSIQGKFAAHGWGATKFDSGEHMHGNWKEKLQVCRDLNWALNHVAASPMPPSNDRWSQAHKIAWEEENLPVAIHSEITKELTKIFQRYQPVDAINQVIHSDLCGNVLFADPLPPLVIDFSPAYRPQEYAEAILVADAIAWEQAPVQLRWELPATTYYTQILLRAVNFRLIVAALFMPDDLNSFHQEYENFRPLLEIL